MLKTVRIFLLLFLMVSNANAQKLALKTNALYWAAYGTLNIAFEHSLSDKWTMEWGVGYNPWTFADNAKVKHILVMPEARYWLCRRYSGHFFAGHILYSHYNAGGIKVPFGIFPELADYRFQGDLGGAGLAYGYNWMLSRRLSLEAEIGLGVMFTKYSKYECRTCGTQVGDESKVFFTPTKLAVNLVYYLK
ncbi:MAG: DUF3575 domain-containing protein [Bacteroidaceae bacterium]|nr:DUF3575 domain-containing protein [Bacteroidaceae bacterium]